MFHIKMASVSFSVGQGLLNFILGSFIIERGTGNGYLASRRGVFCDAIRGFKLGPSYHRHCVGMETRNGLKTTPLMR